MSKMLAATWKNKIDENEANQISQTKKLGILRDPKRAALGELGNRALLKNNDNQKEISIKNGKSVIDLKNVKPRVDTHWKKTAVATKRIVTRSDTIRNSNGEIKGSTADKPIKVSLKNVKNDKQILNVNDNKQLAILRREDSNISQKTLLKLKSTLSKARKDKKEPTVVIAEAHSTQLIREVENIDENDSNNLDLVSEYVNDIYAYLFHCEDVFPIRENHLINQKEVTANMRAVLIDWINEVHHQFQLINETYHMTVGLIDRYLQEVQTTSRRQLQLVGVTALFTASKYEELYPPEIGDFVYITDDTYNKDEIFEMEKRLLRALKFNMGRPLSLHFLRRFSKAAKKIEHHYLLAKYFLELVTVDYSMAHYRPSEIAAASLCLSLLIFNKDNKPEEKLWSPTLQFYSKYTMEHLEPIVKKLAQLVRSAPTAKLTAVYNKYKSSKFGKISMRSELSGPVIDKLCTK